MKKLIFTLTALSMISFASFAQWDDDYGDDNSGWDDTGETDSTATDSTADSWGDGSWDDSGSGGGWSDETSGGSNGTDYVRSARPKFEHRTYERFTGMPYDSATELVTYVEVVEVTVRDDYLGEPYDYQDSLYARASKWLVNQFGKKNAKKMLKKQGPDKENREGLTIKTIGELPLVVTLNDFKKEKSGKIKFDMELRFKDGRYRYKFNNFIHVEEDFVEGKQPIETYLEYYMEAKTNIISNDRVLMATNDQMNELIKELKESCADEPFVDDDDW